jgi:AraC family transcriptional regulator, regulatory protein of adaptative response / methylated-DNA-[protein]-cysteine methyltransferase
MIYSKKIETPIGEILACSVDEGICLVEFTDSPNYDANLKSLTSVLNSHILLSLNEHLDNLENQLFGYFNGSRKDFTVPIFLVGTDFQKKVWTHLLSIDYGKTSTYKEQSISLGNVKAIRAIASANGANRIPIVIPCHRVVGSKGKLTGYSGGLWRKEYLLDLENRQYKINL